MCVYLPLASDRQAALISAVTDVDRLRPFRRSIANRVALALAVIIRTCSPLIERPDVDRGADHVIRRLAGDWFLHRPTSVPLSDANAIYDEGRVNSMWFRVKPICYLVYFGRHLGAGVFSCRVFEDKRLPV